MASGELSHQFEDFLKEATDRAGEPIYRQRISRMISSGSKSLAVDFGDLLKYNDDLANKVLQSPDSALASFRAAAFETMRSENVLYADKIRRDLVVRIRGISDQVPLRKVDTSFLDRMLAVSGMVVRTSELRPLVVDAAWVCPNGHTTVQEQDELQLEKPPRCELCGEARNFELDRKQSRFIDFQIVRIQELPEELPPGQLPQFFDVNLEGDVVNAARPGDRVVLTGILRAVPDYSPGQLRMRLFRSQIDCNYVEVKGKEQEQIQITKQDEAMIKSVAKGPDAYEKLVASMAPAILGHEPEKEAILLLLVGGTSNTLPDGTKLRGDINILLVGDPGCLVADERIVLGNGAIYKMGQLGQSHLQPINYQVLTGEGGGRRDTATTFHVYRRQPVMEIVTESGKSIKGTPNHPLLRLRKVGGRVIREWCRLDKLSVGDRVAVITGFPCTIKEYVRTNFKPIARPKFGPKFHATLPERMTPELAAFYGYLLGDGWVSKDGYRFGFVVAESEMDIMPSLLSMVRNLFGYEPRISTRLRKDRKMPMNYVCMTNEDIAANLGPLREKRVPDLILRSGNEVVKSFLRWLYQADGTVFGNRRGRRAIGLKAKNLELLRDVQMLLLRFGIHSRILGNALLIRRGEDILKFSKHIGFTSEKKKRTLRELATQAKRFKRIHRQRSERIIKVVAHRPEDVYDIEVPNGHRFVANGIVSHNTAKSELLKFTAQVAPRGLFASGRGTSLDYSQPVIVRRSGTTQLVKIGELVDSYYLPGTSGVFVPPADLECLSYHPSKGRIEWTPVDFVYRHRHIAPLMKLGLQSGREVVVTDDHSLYALKDGRLTTIKTKKLRPGDCIAIPGRLPTVDSTAPKSSLYPKDLLGSTHLARLLGYYATEGYLHEGKTKGKESYRIHFELDRDERRIIKDIDDCCRTLFQKGVKAKNRKDSHGVTLTISSKKAFLLLRDVIGVSQGAKRKRVPTIVFNMATAQQLEFIRAYIDGDRGVTSSLNLKSDLLYLIGMSMQKVGKFSTSGPNVGRIGNRLFRGGPSYRLKAPAPYNLDRPVQYLGPPLEEALPPFKKVLDSAKHGLSLITDNGYKRLTKNVLSGLMKGRRKRRVVLLKLLRTKDSMTTSELAYSAGLDRRKTRQILIGLQRTGLIGLSRNSGRLHASLTSRGEEAIEAIEEVQSILDSDLQFVKVNKVRKVRPSSQFVYDLSVKGTENFVAGLGGIICHNTAAGLSAAVIREKNVLMLEAGVVVLADQGIACIDEFDKMRAEDRSALHEQMEQQSYHPSTEILLASGARTTIGELVESEFRRRNSEIKTGFDCEFLDAGASLPVYTADTFENRIMVSRISRLSRHIAPSRFVRIKYSNGRSVTVTPEHPVYVVREGRIETVDAERVREGMFVPAPLRLPTVGSMVELEDVTTEGVRKLVKQPTALSSGLGRVLGYLVSEGNFHKGSNPEVDLTNLDRSILKDMLNGLRSEFGVEPNERRIGTRPSGWRLPSKVILSWFERNFPEMAVKAIAKRVPRQVMAADPAVVTEFLSAAFLGDGSVEPDAICYRTSSPGLATDYQDLLLRLGIASRIDEDASNDSFKVYIRGDSIALFVKQIVQTWDSRRERIEKLLRRSSGNPRSHDTLPTDVTTMLTGIRNGLGLSYNGGFWATLRAGFGITRAKVEAELRELEARYFHIRSVLSDKSLPLRELRSKSGWSQQTMARLAGITRGEVDYLERGGYRGERRRLLEGKIRAALLVHLEAMKGAIGYVRRLEDFRFLRVVEVEEVPNAGEARTEWVYDVTVDRTHNFVSSGVILHNSVTIAKGGIYASLNARTAILAAMNPVLGKYNPFQNLTDNIGDVPIPLLTRFDLIFVIKDQPSLGEDERLATHILTVHSRKTYTKPPPVEFTLLKKYISYAKKGTPALTKEATDKLKEYYLELRKSGGEEGQLPPTPRTLESLIRLATARAKLLLKDEVSEEDALSAVSLMNRMVQDVLTDATTKKTDFGIQLGKPVGERKNLGRAMEIFKSLEGPEKKPIERKTFKEELLKAKFSDDDAEKMIKTMFREGLIYESKPGFFRRVNA